MGTAKFSILKSRKALVVQWFFFCLGKRLKKNAKRVIFFLTDGK